jgi:Flp pilus assembly protein TadD
MSLIIDALKKAQQLRLNGPEGSPILKNPYQNKKRKRSLKKQWIFVGAGLISICILLFVFLKPVSSPSAPQTRRVAVPMERKPSAPIAEKTSSELPKEAASLPKSEEPLPVKQAPNRAGTGQAGIQRPSKAVAALSNRPSPLQEKKKILETKTVPPLPLPLAPEKGEASPKSIGVEQIGGKDRPSASDVLYHFNSGVAFYNQKDFSKAIQAYQKVIELDPTYVEAYNNLGIIYQMIGDVDRAFGAYQKSTEINPKYEKGYNNLGILLLLKGRYEEASEAFQKALAVNSNNIESYIHLGVLFKKKGQWQEAIESYQKALAIDPLHRETHYNIALLYEQLENIELAVGHYQQFIRLSSKSHPELVSRVQRHLNDIMKARNK